MRHVPRWAWAAALVALAAALYLTRVRFEMADFLVYRLTAARALDAAPLYVAEDGHFQFKYLPAFAVAMAPFAWLGAEASKAAWFALSAVLLWMFVRGCIDALPARHRTRGALGGLAVLLMGKFYAHELNLGQSNLLLGVILVRALTAVQGGRAREAGALVGLAIFVKPYAAIVVPWLLPAAGAPAVAAAAAVTAAGLLLPALMYGWAGNLSLLADWWRTVTESTAPNLLGADNVSFAAMWAKWLGIGGPATLLAGASVAIALAIAGWVVARRERVQDAAYLEVGLLMLLIPLVSPQGWDYVLLLGTPALLCLVDRFDEMTTPWRVATALALVVTSFTIYDLVGRALYAGLMAASVVSVSAAGLVACTAHLRARELA